MYGAVLLKADVLGAMSILLKSRINVYAVARRTKMRLMRSSKNNVSTVVSLGNFFNHLFQNNSQVTMSILCVKLEDQFRRCNRSYINPKKTFNTNGVI